MAGLPEELASPSSQTSEKCAITFAPTEQSFATGIGNSLQLWSRSASGTWQESDKKDVAGRVLALAFSPNGDHLASAGDRLAAGGDRAHILLWEVVNTRLYKPQWPSKGTLGEYVSSLAFDREGELLAAGADDAIATVWRLPGLDEVSQSGVHDRSLTALVSGRRFGTGLLVSADAEGQLVLCAEGIDDKHCARLGRRTEREIRGLAANADLSRLVVAEDRLWVWDLRRQTMLDAVGRLRKPDTQDVSANPPD